MEGVLKLRSEFQITLTFSAAIRYKEKGHGKQGSWKQRINFFHRKLSIISKRYYQ